MRRAALAALLLVCACARDAHVRPGDTVVLRYGLSADGSVVESDTVEIDQGEGQVLPAADEALLGMKPGEEKTLELPPEKAFGPRDEAKVESVPLKKFGDLAKGLEAGNKVQGFRDGKPETARVLSIKNGAASLDFNSPLAGRTVTYRLRVLSISSRR